MNITVLAIWVKALILTHFFISPATPTTPLHPSPLFQPAISNLNEKKRTSNELYL